jgi:hypothetical protein
MGDALAFKKNDVGTLPEQGEGFEQNGRFTKGEQSGEYLFSNRLFFGIQRAVNAALRDGRQTVSKSVLIPRWTGFALDPCLAPQGQVFFLICVIRPVSGGIDAPFSSSKVVAK